jgi:hypothetical protein
MIRGFFGPIYPAQISALWSPMVNFDLIDPNNSETALQAELVALIDTGSDFCRIDAALATKHNLVSIGEVHDVSGGTNGMVKAYSVSTRLGDGTRLVVQCPAGQFRGAGAAFDLLFGMDAIGRFEILIARSQQEVTLRKS